MTRLVAWSWNYLVLVTVTDSRRWGIIFTYRYRFPASMELISVTVTNPLLFRINLVTISAARVAQNRSKSLKVAQTRSKYLKIAQNRSK